MIFSVAAIIALALYPWWTFANHRPRSVNKFNQWEFEYINLHRYSWKETPNVGARFTLYRSYNQECPNGGSGLAMVLGGGSLLCGHVIPDEPVVCSAGIAFDGPPSPWKPTASWFTCDDQPRAVEGEKEISNERKEWLKWRVIDLEELDRKSLPEPKPGYAGALLFKSAKLQVVNGVPLKE